MNKELRTQVYEKYDGHCAYCGAEIEYKDMQVDHLIPQRIGGSDKIENLMPSCRLCNHYKRALSLEHFREQVFSLQSRLEKIYIVKVAVKYGIIKFQNRGQKFHFETR